MLTGDSDSGGGGGAGGGGAGAGGECIVLSDRPSDSGSVPIPIVKVCDWPGSLISH